MSFSGCNANEATNVAVAPIKENNNIVLKETEIKEKVEEEVKKEIQEEKKDVVQNVDEDIEVDSQKQEKETAKIEDKEKFKTYNYWVVFYDQYDNELQREELKYGAVPEFEGWLPEGFEKWVYKKSGKDVGKFKAITGNTYFKAVCHEVEHYSGGPSGGSSNPPAPNPPTPTGCPYKGSQLYYIYDQQFMTSYTFMWTWNGSSYDIQSVVPVPLAFSSYSIGDFVHNDSGSYHKCDYSGDGVSVPSLKTVTISVNNGTGGGDHLVPVGTTYELSSSGGIYFKFNGQQFDSYSTYPDSFFVFYSWNDGSASGQTLSGTVTDNMTITADYVPET